MKEILWHTMPEQNIFKELKAKNTGLKQKEAEKRIKKYGKNQLPKKEKISGFLILLSQFKSPLVYILVVASIFSLVLQNWADFLIIAVIIVINAVVGFIQENKANNALEFLRSAVQFKAKVLRDGQETEIETKYLVAGDWVFLEAGDRVPADIRLMECNNIEANESSLTGESAPVQKKIEVLKKGIPLGDRSNMVFMGTNITRGKASGLVCEIGGHTELGKIATLVKDTEETLTPLQIQLKKFSRYLTIVVLFATLSVFILGYINQQEDILYTSVALAVAAIPEGLIIAVTVILSIGMQTILKKKALIRKLVAAETLGSTSVICTDKTGTITIGRMQVAKIFVGEKNFTVLESAKKDHKEIAKSIFTIATLCNNAIIENPDNALKDWSIIGDPMEGALLIGARGAGIDIQKLKNEFPRKEEVPFDSETKFMVTRNKLNEKNDILYIKGACEKILEQSTYVKKEGKKITLSPEYRKKLIQKYESLSKQGLRLLAFGEKTITKKNKLKDSISDFTFIGFIALKDPLRPEAKKTLALTKIAGIKTVVITGDHKLTAQAIVEEMGMKVNEENIFEGEQLDKITDEKLKNLVPKILVYARVSPQHKLRIIQAWQARGEVVAMTGDGVNDAPAIKAADIGIALNSGTDVAKQTSDVILLDNNFETIVEAVRQGRIIFDNIRKVIVYLVSDSFAAMILVASAMILGLPLPVLPAQILWINLIDDGLPALAITLEPGEKEVIEDKPRKRNEPVIDMKIGSLILTIGICANIIYFVLFFWLLKKTSNIDYIRTMMFTLMALTTLLYVFSVRSLRKSIFSKNLFANKYLLGSVFIGLALQCLAIYQPHLQKLFHTVPLGIKDWMVIVLLSATILVVIEFFKIFVLKKKKLV